MYETYEINYIYYWTRPHSQMCVHLWIKQYYFVCIRTYLYVLRRSIASVGMLLGERWGACLCFDICMMALASPPAPVLSQNVQNWLLITSAAVGSCSADWRAVFHIDKVTDQLRIMKWIKAQSCIQYVCRCASLQEVYIYTSGGSGLAKLIFLSFRSMGTVSQW
jgi:hypothetical protein